jgi:enoyl-CoA hydratase/carnithine racemase
MGTEVIDASASAVRTESFGPVHLELADGVATVLVDSPPVNAMGRAVLGGLESAARRIASSEDVRAVVLTGGGTKAFMAGADISEFEELRAAPDGMERQSQWAGGVLRAWADLPQPVIAAVQASAVGGGLEIALTADLIVTEPRAKFGLPEVRLGLIPGGGGTQRLPLRVGTAAARRLMYLAEIVDATRAAELGLVDVVSEPGAVLAEARELAASIAAMPRVAVQAIKAASRPELGQGLDEERRLFLQSAASEDFVEGFTAFAEKRAPRFRHR